MLSKNMQYAFQKEYQERILLSEGISDAKELNNELLSVLRDDRLIEVFNQSKEIQQRLTESGAQSFSMSVGYFAKEISVVKEALYVYLKNENSLVNAKNKPFSSHLCKITHSMQLNSFYSFIGHPEWETHIVRILLNHIEEYGIKIIIPILLKSPVIWKRRNKWVDFFRNSEGHN